MTLLLQFLMHNVLPSLVAGLLVWLAVRAAIAAFQIEHGTLRLCLLSAPVLKSTLVLVGVGLVFPWPQQVFSAWHASALPPSSVLPVLALWAGLALIAREALARRARRAVLQGSQVADGKHPRLTRALDRVMKAFDSRARDLTQRCRPRIRRPQLRVAGRRLPSPAALASERWPVIVFPADLEQRLTDAELEGALAHEVAHIALRRPWWCSSLTLGSVAGAMPTATLMAAQVRGEEERACDQIAVAAVGQPEAYAEMLLKSYRFAVEQRRPFVGRLRYVPQLLGFQLTLSERIERMIQAPSRPQRIRLQLFATWGAWMALYLLFFR